MTEKTVDNKVVNAFCLSRYLGTWFEIARFPHRFEKGLAGVTATYTLRPDGRIEVLNRGYKNIPGGEPRIARGRAKPAGKNNEGKLKVSFFLFFYSDYNILELDTVNYNYAMVGSKSPEYLWILSRTRSMPDSVYSILVNSAMKRGYDISKLEKVLQPSL